MYDNVSINWLGALIALVLVSVLAGLYFTVIIAKAYNAALGRPADAPAAAGPLFIAGPLVCNALIVITSAVLISALDVTGLGDGLLFGATVGVGYLSAMTFQIAINPVFPRPLFYGLINAPYFLLASLVTGACLTLIG